MSVVVKGVTRHTRYRNAHRAYSLSMSVSATMIRLGVQMDAFIQGEENVPDNTNIANDHVVSILQQHDLISGVQMAEAFSEQLELAFNQVAIAVLRHHGARNAMQVVHCLWDTFSNHWVTPTEISSDDAFDAVGALIPRGDLESILEALRPQLMQAIADIKNDQPLQTSVQQQQPQQQQQQQQQQQKQAIPNHCQPTMPTEAGATQHLHFSNSGNSSHPADNDVDMT
ncbi:hypothetical protein BX666DRAFT_2090978 [Dichotomocladium elegans]|nr:hypothetical protein BX666DRAFT_2090978 [Dichotomocladium elegans]